MKESLGVIGMMPLPLINSAIKAGLGVVGLGLVEHLDMPSEVLYLSLQQDLGGLFPIDPNDFHARLAKAAKSQDVNAVAYSGGFENCPDLIADLSGDFELLGNSPASLRMVRDPFRLAEVVASAGLETPQILSPGSQPDPNLRWLRKMVKSGAGLAIEPWDQVVPDDPQYIVQRWLDGKSQSVSFIANGKDTKIFSFTEQLIGDPAFGAHGFAYVGNLLLPQPNPSLLKKLNLLATTLTREFGLVGLNGIDFISNGEQISILEVNPRFSASMELVEDAFGVSLFEWHIAGCRGQALPEIPERQNQDVYGIATVIAKQTGVLPDTNEWLEKGWHAIPLPGQPVFAGYPICKVTSMGHNTEQCYKNLLAEANEVMGGVKGR